MVSTVRYCSPSYACPYQNAFWDGTQMVYGQGFAGADDVVAHELTHGVTEYTSNLTYVFQSGAINEAFSDIFGEFVDQLNNSRNTDNLGTLWRIGEDLPGYPNGIRDMKNPLTFGDPDKVTSPNYYCKALTVTNNDNGGVHHNSGILNKAAYLIT
ncbi:MAG TPA: M4 family metallopeptidase, partial [Anaerolinea sp.]|nr:M4 family metallopeptidase [Anaerolinea sp.]